jgi:hypothetical protein
MGRAARFDSFSPISSAIHLIIFLSELLFGLLIFFLSNLNLEKI